MNDQSMIIIVGDPPTLVCNQCGDLYPITLPQPAWAMAAICDGFAKEHRECKERNLEEKEVNRVIEQGRRAFDAGRVGESGMPGRQR